MAGAEERFASIAAVGGRTRQATIVNILSFSELAVHLCIVPQTL
jgi:hypothetical protein